MVFEHIEKLKREYTDKYVVVDTSRPELTRFRGQTGLVKTVNMSGRALVQFDAWNNVGWYDIELDFLKVVPKPEPKPAQQKVKEQSPPAAVHSKAAVFGAPGETQKDITPPDSKPGVAAKPSTADVLAAARANKAGSAVPAEQPKPAGGKLSTADILAAARAKNAASAAAAPSAPAAKPAAPSTKPSTADILAAARAKAAPAQPVAPVAEEPPAEEVDEPVAVAAPVVPAPRSAAAAGPKPTTTAEIIAWCRTHDGK